MPCQNSSTESADKLDRLIERIERLETAIASLTQAINRLPEFTQSQQNYAP